MLCRSLLAVIAAYSGGSLGDGQWPQLPTFDRQSINGFSTACCWGSCLEVVLLFRALRRMREPV